MPLDLLLVMGKNFLVFLPRAHPLQIPSCFGETSGIPLTIFCNPGRALSASLIFNQCLELFEFVKGFTLGLEEVNPRLLRVIINKQRFLGMNLETSKYNINPLGLKSLQRDMEGHKYVINHVW